VYRVDPAELKHPLSFYISRNQSLRKRRYGGADLFRAVAEKRGWPREYIKCMALVESQPLAFQRWKEFLLHLRGHILG